ncbi:MAG TPA: hypothetical protein VKF84_08940 [Candidatus Sulfotelmatobacter sp.]|nr:hypothetical protein [Candidatus Sulfotelmatobacter sp.]
MTSRTRLLGITTLSLFFAFGAVMSGLAAVMLLFPGSMLDPLWRVNPRAREGFAGLGVWAVLLMAVVCLACVTAATGLWRCRRWGLWSALAILGVNLVGDAANAALAHDWRALIGLPVCAAMILYLLAHRRVRPWDIVSKSREMHPAISLVAPVATVDCPKRVET